MREPCKWCGSEAAEGVCPKSVVCPKCDAGPGRSCVRPSSHRADKLHAARWEFAEALDAALDAALDLRVRSHRARAAGEISVKQHLEELGRVREVEDRVEPLRASAYSRAYQRCLDEGSVLVEPGGRHALAANVPVGTQLAFA